MRWLKIFEDGVELKKKNQRDENRFSLEYCKNHDIVHLRWGAKTFHLRRSEYLKLSDVMSEFGQFLRVQMEDLPMSLDNIPADGMKH